MSDLPDLPDVLRCAHWRGPVPNERPGAVSRPFLGLVLHVEVGTEAGTDAWFHDPQAQASAHLGIPKTGGTVDQWVPLTDRAWAEAAGNARWLSAETEGQPDEPLTDDQLEALATAYAELHRASPTEFPLHSSESPTEPGLGWHGMGGTAWGGHLSCPGELRRAQRPEILARAVRILRPTPAPTPHRSPDPAPPRYPGHLLELGVHGPEVSTWQAHMRARGWRIAVDGDYGPASARVCAEFEAEKGLRVDGKVGPVVWAATWRARVTP